MSTNEITRKKRGKAAAAMAAPVVEFTAAAHEHVELAFDTTVTPTANTQDLGPFDIPAFGYLRHLLITVEGSGGTAGTPVADAPWTVIQEATLSDVNGGVIVGPISGYNLFLANLYGGYVFRQDPRLWNDFVGTTPNYVFALRMPVEIQHGNGLGALANQNSAAAYKLRIRMANIAGTWSVAPSPVPAFRVRGWLEAWTLPAPFDALGRGVATEPPRHGTTQFWTVQTKQISAGNNNTLVSRVGNLIRTLILVFRTAGGVRQANVGPDPIELRWDSRQLLFESQVVRRGYMSERYIYTGTTVETGVFVYSFDHDVLGHAGDGTPELWLPTVQATRLEVVGTGVTAGTVDIIVNDVAPAEINPAMRYSEAGTAFHPGPVGPVAITS